MAVQELETDITTIAGNPNIGLVFLSEVDWTDSQLQTLEAKYPGLLRKHREMIADGSLKPGSIAKFTFDAGTVIVGNIHLKQGPLVDYVYMRDCFIKIKNNAEKLPKEIYTPIVGRQSIEPGLFTLMLSVLFREFPGNVFICK